MSHTGDYLDTAGLARRWLLSPRTLEGWRRRGIGPRFVRIEGRIRCRLLDIEVYEVMRLTGGRSA